MLPVVTVENDGFSARRLHGILFDMGQKQKIKPKNSDEKVVEEYERRLLRLFGFLAFVVEEADKLGCAKTAIEARRAGLQLCYEAGAEDELHFAFGDRMPGHG